MGYDFSVLEKITIYFTKNKFSLSIKTPSIEHSFTISTVIENRIISFALLLSVQSSRMRIHRLLTFSSVQTSVLCVYRILVKESPKLLLISEILGVFYVFWKLPVESFW